MFRTVLYGLVTLVLLTGSVLAAGYISLKAPATQGRVLALNDAEHSLLAAAREGDTEGVAGLLKAGTPPDARDARGFTPLILAASHGHLDTVRALLAGGADACAGDARGNTALLRAAFKGYAEVVEVLNQQPCAVEQANRLGQTALMLASLFGRQEVAEKLRQRGASPELRAPILKTASRRPQFITGVRQ